MQLKTPTLQEAVDTAISVAENYNITCAKPEILHAAGNVWIHLEPMPVVAQVPKDVVSVRGPSTLTHLERDLAVCTFLANSGLAVGAPSDLLPPGPHEKNGILVTFYRYYERGDRDDVRAGAALHDLHEALRIYDGSLSELSAPITEPRRLLGLLQASQLLSTGQIQLLRNRLDIAERYIIGWPLRPVHGDVHLQNVLWTTNGPLWTDWEDVCLAPLLWDLACLVTSTQLYGIPSERLAQTLKGYGNPKLVLQELKPFIHARVVGVSCWAATRAGHDERAQKRLRDGLNWLRHHHL